MSKQKAEDKFSAPAPALGYLYQVWYALYLILTAESEDTGIFIEKLDDIQLGEHLVQTKHHVDEESLGDSSSDLWKTIRVWSEHLQNDIISLKDSCILTLITTSTAKDGSIADLLRDDNHRDTHKAYERLLEIANKSNNEKLQSAFEAFKNLTDTKRSALVEKIKIIDNAPNISKIPQKISKLLIGTRVEHRDEIVERLIGWWDKQVCQHLLNKSKNPIKEYEINSKLISINDYYKPDNLPTQYAGEKCEIDIENDDRCFVIHLKKITDSKKDKRLIERAILDFYRASNERSGWLREGLLNKFENGEDEIHRYEKKLISKWAMCLEDVRHEYDDFDELDDSKKRKAGFKVFSKTRDADIRIRERVTEPYIMQGSYHILANDDRVAWHPDPAKTIYEKEDL